MDGSVLLGILKVVVISLAPVVIVASFRHARAAGVWSVVLARRLHLLRPPPVLPDGPPLETLAATLRRLRPRVHSPRPGTAIARQRGINAAYDGALVNTARALDVPTALADLPDGFEQEAERMRLEHALAAAGLVWEVPEDQPHDPAA
jgi:hypothetical protein